MNTCEDVIKKYRGIDLDDLDALNPSFSCVLCGNYKCSKHNTPGHCCPERVKISESEWALFYNFKA